MNYKWAIKTAHFCEIGVIGKWESLEDPARKVYQQAESEADRNCKWYFEYYPTMDDAYKAWEKERKCVRTWTQFAGNCYIEYADIACLVSEEWDTDEDGEEYYSQDYYRECAARSLQFVEGEELRGLVEVF